MKPHQKVVEDASLIEVMQAAASWGMSCLMNIKR
jgi:hypothetical protein